MNVGFCWRYEPFSLLPFKDSPMWGFGPFPRSQLAINSGEWPAMKSIA